MTNNGPIEDNDTTLFSTSKTIQNEDYGISIKVDSSNEDHFILSATPTKTATTTLKHVLRNNVLVISNLE